MAKENENKTEKISKCMLKIQKEIHAARSPVQNSSIICMVFCIIHAHNRLTELYTIQDNIEN